MKINYFRLVLLILTVTVVMIIASCEKDPTSSDKPTEGEIAIVSAVPNPDGFSGSLYLQLIDDISPATYDNTTALPFTMNSDQITVRGDNIYKLPWLDSDVIEKYTRNDEGGLDKTGEYIMEANSGPTSIIYQNDTKAYIALSGRPKILIVNPLTMEKSGEIDISAYAVGDGNPDAQQMIIRDGKLFVALAQAVGGFYASPDRAKVDVLVINTEMNVVEKMITEETSSFSQPTRPIEANQIFTDENNDIYIICQSAFGAVPSHKLGILRIKNGETEFDAGYSFNMEDAPIINDPFNATTLFCAQYAGNGKLYGQAAVMAYFTTGSFVEDRFFVPVEVDLYAQTITALDLPRSNGFGSTGLYEDKIMFGLATDTDNGFYTYDMATGEISAEAIIKTTGTPFYFKHFGEEW